MDAPETHPSVVFTELAMGTATEIVRRIGNLRMPSGHKTERLGVSRSQAVNILPVEKQGEAETRTRLHAPFFLGQTF